MSRIYKALTELYDTDDNIRTQLRITERHLLLIKEEKKLPRWLTISLVRDCKINPLYMEGISKKKFLTL